MVGLWLISLCDLMFQNEWGVDSTYLAKLKEQYKKEKKNKKSPKSKQVQAVNWQQS